MNHYNKCAKTLFQQAEKLRRHCRQGSYKTRERYYAAFKRFLLFLAITYGLQKIANISGKHLSAYVRHMQENNLSASTIKTDLAAIRFWHDQIPQAKYLLPENHEFDLERRSFRGTDRTWTKEEFQHMLSEAERIGKPDYRAAMMLARYAGLRVHEIFRLDTATAIAALREGNITVKGKGGKVRSVPCCDEVNVVLKERLQVTSSGQKLFIPVGRETHHAIKNFQQFIADHRLPRSGEPERTVHGLRHMYAIEAYQRLIHDGKSEKLARMKVSRLIGHQREDVTEIYLTSIRKNG